MKRPSKNTTCKVWRVRCDWCQDLIIAPNVVAAVEAFRTLVADTVRETKMYVPPDEIEPLEVTYVGEMSLDKKQVSTIQKHAR